jgi:nicotinate phosphoribosyltransferase
MRGGRRLAAPPTLAAIQTRAAHDLERLPDPLRRLEPGASYPVRVGDRLVELAADFDRRLAQHDRGQP